MGVRTTMTSHTDQPAANVGLVPPPRGSDVGAASADPPRLSGGAAVTSAAAGPVAAAPGADTTRVPRKRSVTWSVTVTPRTRVDAVIVAPPRRCARSGRSFTQAR